MSTWRMWVTCPNCKEEFRATFEQFVDLSAYPHLRDSLLAGESNFLYCPHCGTPSYIDGFAINDPKERQLIFFVPNLMHKVAWVEVLKKGVPIAFGKRKSYLKKPIIIDDWQELINLLNKSEKIARDKYKDNILKIIDSFFSVPSLKELQKIIELNPVLLTDDTILILGNLYRVAKEKRNKEVFNKAILGRLILAKCREKGVDVAIQHIEDNWEISKTKSSELFLEVPMEEVEELITSITLIDIQLLERMIQNDPYRIPNLTNLYHLALTYPEIINDPNLRSAVHSGLGYCYHHYPNANIVWCLRQAEAQLQEALTDTVPEVNSSQYSNIRNELGLVYMELPTGDLTENLYQAANCFQEALRYRTAENTPERYAETIHNLGIVLSKYQEGDQEENLKTAIDCFQEALKYHTAADTPIEFAKTSNSIGSVLYELAKKDNNYLKQAIEYFENALAVWDELMPNGVFHCMTLINLGRAYLDTEEPEAVDFAIRCFQKVLASLDKDRYTHRAALTYETLATAYWKKWSKNPAYYQERVFENLQKALDNLPVIENAYNEFPEDVRRISMKLGSLYFQSGNWHAAAEAYREAIVANEALALTTSSSVSLVHELSQTSDLFVHYSYVLARLNEFESAINLLETGRTQILSKALVINQAPIDQLTPKDREVFLDAQKRIKSIEYKIRILVASQQDFIQSSQFVELSNELRQSYKEIWQLSRFLNQKELTDEAGKSYLDDLTGNVLPDQPIVYLMTTGKGSLALVVPHNLKAFSSENAFWIDSFTNAQLNDILWKEKEKNFTSETGGYIPALFRSSVLKPVLDEVLPILKKKLLSPLISYLKQNGYKQVSLIPCGLLAILPLHATIPSEMTFSYIPSAGALRSARNAEAKRNMKKENLLALGNPMPNPVPLSYALMEVEKISTFFPEGKRNLLAEQRANLANLKSALPGSTHLHFACHGEFTLDSPVQSSLSLSGEDKLSLNDILTERFDLSSIRLVVLSACQTGMVDVMKVPDEAIGFPAGFIQAGIPAVISTLWPVADIPTAYLMTKFYEFHLKKKLKPAIALNKAQQWLKEACFEELRATIDLKKIKQRSIVTERGVRIENWMEQAGNQKPFAHPYYWAAFYYTGI